MCGLVGVAGDIGFGKTKDMFTELLVVDSLRGMHSTGVAMVKRFQDEVKLIKKPGPSQMLVLDSQYKSAIGDPLKVIIGHNRFATKGAHTEQNAHPFQFSNVVGAHNGTLDAWSIKRLHHHEKFETDSEAIFSHINEYGIEEAVKQMSGAWALTWFDKRDNTLNMLRNSQRPLFYTYNKDRTILMWASEIEMLDFTLSRNHVKMEDQAFFKVEVDTHTKWKLPLQLTGKFETPEQTPLKAPSVYVSEGRPYGNRNGYGVFTNGMSDDEWDEYGMYADCGWYPGKNPTPVVITKKVEDKPNVDATFREGPVGETVPSGVGSELDNVLPFTPNVPKKGSFTSRVDTKKFRTPYKDDKGKILSKKDFYRIVNNGCVYCSDSSVNWGQFIKVLPEEHAGIKLFLCEDCYNNDEILQCCSYSAK